MIFILIETIKFRGMEQTVTVKQQFHFDKVKNYLYRIFILM
jgi:hypothetical protein